MPTWLASPAMSITTAMSFIENQKTGWHGLRRLEARDMPPGGFWKISRNPEFVRGKHVNLHYTSCY